MLINCEQMAKEDKVLRKDGRLNKKGIQLMENLLNSPVVGRFELIYGGWLEERLPDD